MADITVPIGELQAASGPITVPVEALSAQPDFRQSDTTPNEEVTYGRSAAYRQAGKSAYDALSELKSLNPFEFNRFVQSAFWHPLQTLGAIGKGQGDEYDKAVAAFKSGDYLTGAVRAITYLTPLVGPRLGQAIDQLKSGQYAKGAGATLDAVLPFILPEAGKLMPESVGLAPRVADASLTDAARSSNAFAAERGIPLDAATKTGSPFLRSVQKRVANSMGGEGTASEMIAAQRAGLARTGQELAADIHPEAATAESAGAGVVGAMQDTIKALQGRANEQYGVAREIERNPANLETVQTAPAGSASEARIRAKLNDGAPGVHPPTSAEMVAMRAIARELEEQPYKQGRQVRDLENLDASNDRYDSGHAGTPIYQAVFDAAGKALARGEMGASDVVNMTRGDMKAGILKTLNTGEWTTAAKMAYRLVQEKGAGAWEGSPYVDQRAPVLGSEQTLALPVAVADVQAALKPIHARLLQESQLSPLMGAKAKALTVLDRFVNGPAHVSLSTAEGVLSDLKGASRGAAMSELRDVGQGSAAYAVKALSKAIEDSAAERSPEALSAIEEGRSAVKAKYEVADLLKEMRDEPVQTFNRLTARGDVNKRLLFKVRDVAPQQMPVIARAWLENQLDLATREGGFAHVDRLWSEWGKLGKETKQALFPSPGQAQALDQFFLLAKRLGENPNPSGTAHVSTVFNFVSQVGTFPLAKLLYTKRGVDALTRVMRLEGMRIPGPNPAAVSGAARAAAYANLADAAKAAGVELPKAAGASPAGSGQGTQSQK